MSTARRPLGRGPALPSSRCTGPADWSTWPSSTNEVYSAAHSSPLE
ncbi:hypothetical protein AB0H07_46715 [Streptomyces sp. NPDC021354]